MSAGKGESGHLNEAGHKSEELAQVNVLLPLEAIDRAIGSDIKVLLINNKEFQGKLVGFDDFVNVVLEQVVEIQDGKKKDPLLKKMLLNGAQIAMLCPL